MLQGSGLGDLPGGLALLAAGSFSKAGISRCWEATDKLLVPSIFLFIRYLPGPRQPCVQRWWPLGLFAVSHLRSNAFCQNPFVSCGLTPLLPNHTRFRACCETSDLCHLAAKPLICSQTPHNGLMRSMLSQPPLIPSVTPQLWDFPVKLPALCRRNTVRACLNFAGWLLWRHRNTSE